jgi:hypothetical protein
LAWPVRGSPVAGLGEALGEAIRGAPGCRLAPLAAAGCCAGRPLLSSDCCGVAAGVALVVLVCVLLLVVAPIVTTVPKTAASTAPAPATARFRRDLAEAGYPR